VNIAADDVPSLVVSRYNTFVDRTDGVMSFNSRTGTFALLSHAVASTLRANEVPPDEGVRLSFLSLGFYIGR